MSPGCPGPQETLKMKQPDRARGSRPECDLLPGSLRCLALTSQGSTRVPRARCLCWSLPRRAHDGFCRLALLYEEREEKRRLLHLMRTAGGDGSRGDSARTQRHELWSKTPRTLEGAHMTSKRSAVCPCPALSACSLVHSRRIPAKRSKVLVFPTNSLHSFLLPKALTASIIQKNRSVGLQISHLNRDTRFQKHAKKTWARNISGTARRAIGSKTSWRQHLARLKCCSRLRWRVRVIALMPRAGSGESGKGTGGGATKLVEERLSNQRLET
eukprot:388362-Hanusia_phi.AAC.1